MSKTIIIPDIHCDFATAEGIISKEKPDYTIFLGDYFDNWDEDPAVAYSTAKWLKRSMNKKDRIHLVGNHELYYMTGNLGLRCSGNTEWKYDVINSCNIDWQNMKIYYWLEDWLVTHAGLSKLFFDLHSKGRSVRQYLEDAEKEVREIAHIKCPELFQCGMRRDGNHEFGGIVWCDIHEFLRIPGLHQIFGHTCHPLPMILYEEDEKLNAICLDTNLRYYAVYEEGKMETRPSFTRMPIE